MVEGQDACLRWRGHGQLLDDDIIRSLKGQGVVGDDGVGGCVPTSPHPQLAPTLTSMTTDLGTGFMRWSTAKMRQSTGRGHGGQGEGGWHEDIQKWVLGPSEDARQVTQHPQMPPRPQGAMEGTQPPRNTPVVPGV